MSATKREIDRERLKLRTALEEIMAYTVPGARNDLEVSLAAIHNYCARKLGCIEMTSADWVRRHRSEVEFRRRQNALDAERAKVTP